MKSAAAQGPAMSGGESRRPGDSDRPVVAPKMWKSMMILLTLVVTAVMAGVSAPRAPGCSCEDDAYAVLDPSITRWQLGSDFMIALAYFSIPLELAYFVSYSVVFPFRWLIMQFGAFIVLCGSTHFVSIWTFGPHSYSVLVTQTVLKVLTAVVSCVTAIRLVHIIPQLLHAKVREHFLKHKAAELDREMDIIKTREEVGRHVRTLTHVIRSTLDRHKILNTALLELSRTLRLENCTIWMPIADGNGLELTHEFARREVQSPVTISAGDASVQSIVQSRKPVTIPPTCALGRASNHNRLAGAMTAIRLPLLHVSNFKGGTPEVVNASYAVLVLVLPSASGRQWEAHELQMIEVVADQVAVALSHAAVLEDSQRTRDKLADQNKALHLARQEAVTAIRARNDFLAVMNHEMRTPMHAIIALSSLLQGGSLSVDQRAMVETIVKSSSLLSTLINDVLDFSRLEDGSLQLDYAYFDLQAVLREAGNLAKPMAKGKGLDLIFRVEEDVPTDVMGDEKRLLQTMLNVVGNAVKFTKTGFVSVLVRVEKGPARWDPQQPEWRPEECEGHVYVRFEVKDSGLGVRDTDIPRLFHKFVQADSTFTRNYGGTGLGLAICKKFVELMHGHIWLESDGLGKGSIVRFVIRLQKAQKPVQSIRPPDQSGSQGGQLQQPRQDDTNSGLRGLKVLVTDDNSVNRIVTRRLLDRLGCKTTVVESGHQCLATLAQPGSSFEVLLLDLCMPEMDGYEVATRIRQRFRPENRPLVVALTANTDNDTRERCMQIGMDGIVLKPISLAEMSTELTKLLRKSASESPR